MAEEEGQGQGGQDQNAFDLKTWTAGLGEAVAAARSDNESGGDQGEGVLGSTPGYTPRPRGVGGWDIGWGQGGPAGDLYRERDVNQILDRMSPWDLADLQAQLAEAGVLGDGYRESWPDQDTTKAFETVLTLSNRTNRDWRSTVSALQSQALQAEAARLRNQPAPPRLTTQVSDPETLRGLFQDKVVGMTGEDRGSVDVDQMVEGYQNLERRYQQQSWNANLRGGGGEIVALPTAEAFAEQAISEAAPTEVQARGVVDRAGDLFGMLGSFGGIA